MYGQLGAGYVRVWDRRPHSREDTGIRVGGTLNALDREDYQIWLDQRRQGASEFLRVGGSWQSAVVREHQDRRCQFVSVLLDVFESLPVHVGG